MVLIKWKCSLTFLKILILAFLLETKCSHIKYSAEIFKLPDALNSGKTSHSSSQAVDARSKASQIFHHKQHFSSLKFNISKSSKHFFHIPKILKLLGLRRRIVDHKNFIPKIYFEKHLPKKLSLIIQNQSNSAYYLKHFLNNSIKLRHKRQSGDSNYSSPGPITTVVTPVKEILNTPGLPNTTSENKTVYERRLSEPGINGTAVNSSVRSAVKETTTTIVIDADRLYSNVSSNVTGSHILSQISPALGDGNKAGVTPLHTTPLSADSIHSHALINSSISPENATSKFSPEFHNVTSYVEEPTAKELSTQTVPLTSSVKGAQPLASSSTTLQQTTQAIIVKTTIRTTSSQLVTTQVQPTEKTIPPAAITLTSKSLSTTSLSPTPKAEPSPTSASQGVNSIPSAEPESVSTAINNVGSNPEPETIPKEELKGESSPNVTPKKPPSNGSSTSTHLPDNQFSVPEPEPEGGAEPEPEPKLVTMATNNTTKSTDIPSPEPTFIPFAEPNPDWEVAKVIWREAWPIHIYAMGTAFALLAAFSLISIIRLWRIKHLFSQKYFITLNLLMFLMGVIRAIYLLIDGYNSRNIYPRVVDYFLFSTGFPCLTSAFSILFFALLQATRMQLVGPRVQKVQVLIAIIVCHFGISIITDVVVGYFYGARIMLFLCELVSVLWGLFLVIGYCYIFRRLYAAALKRQKVMERLSTVRSSQSPAVNGKPVSVSDRKPSRTDSGVVVKPTHKYTLSLAVKVTLGTAILGFVFIGLEMYGMFGVFGVFSQETPEPWPWWGFEFGLRLVELLMCVTMSYIGTQPFRYVEGLRNRRWCFYCAACRELIRPRCGTKAGNDHIAWDDIEQPSSASSQADAQQSCIVYRKKAESKAPAKTPKAYEAIQMQVKNSKENGHVGSNGHINPSLESGSESRPVSMLVVEDGFIRFRNDAELVMVMSSGGDSLVGDSAVLKTDDCANDLVNGATLVLSKTNFNTNHSMPNGDGGKDCSNTEHVHGIINDGYSGGADSSRNSGVISETNLNSPQDRQLADGLSDARSASSMQSYSRSNFSESIEQELQNLIVRKPSLGMEKAKSSTNLPDEIEDNYFTNSFIFTQKPDHVITGIRSPPNEHVLQYSLLARSMPCSPIKTLLHSPSDKRKLLSRSNSDHLPVIKKHASVRTKVFNNAKYFSLSDLELQIKTEDLEQGPELVQQPPQSNTVKLISSRKVSDPDVMNKPRNVDEKLSPKNGSAPSKNGSSTKKPPSSKTKKPREERSRAGDSDHSEC